MILYLVDLAVICADFVGHVGLESPNILVLQLTQPCILNNLYAKLRKLPVSRILSFIAPEKQENPEGCSFGDPIGKANDVLPVPDRLVG